MFSSEDGQFFYKAAIGEDAYCVGQTWMLQGDSEYYSDALHPEHLLPAQRKATASKFEESQVPPAKGGTLDASGSIQWMGSEQLLKPMVLQELHPSIERAMCTGCAQAVARDYESIEV